MGAAGVNTLDYIFTCECDVESDWLIYSMQVPHSIPHINIIICRFPASAAECRAPTPAAGVTVEQYNTTIVGSVIVYQCEQSGFTPSSASSTCEANEMWSPDPFQVVCSMTPPPPTGRVRECSNCLLFSDSFIAIATYMCQPPCL